MAVTESAPPVIDVALLSDLRDRIRATRFVQPQPDPGRRLGAEPGFLRELLRHWSEEYDWRRCEQRVRSLPWVVAGRGDSPIRAVHRRASTSDAPAVVLLHGWPDSVLRFEWVLPHLGDMHLVVPALPGYPFALPTAESSVSAGVMADSVAEAMADLGYDRYVVSGGDVGADVAESLASDHAEHVAALHLTEVSHQHALIDPPTDLTDEERAYLQRLQRWHAEEGGYNHEQSTRPNTLAVGLGDSPAGLAAWIVEKQQRWSDCDGDVENVFTRDEVLDWVTAYWVTGAIGTSFSPYANKRPAGRITAPTAFTLFPRDIVSTPRAFAARFFDIRSWTVAPAGGHFDAWERPLDYANGVRRAVEHRSR